MSKSFDYMQGLRYCRDMYEPLMSMPPAMFADQGGFEGLISNLRSSLPLRPPRFGEAISDFISELEAAMRANEHLKTNDTQPETIHYAMTPPMIEECMRMRGNGMSYAGIARDMDVPVNTVRNYIARQNRSRQ